MKKKGILLLLSFIAVAFIWLFEIKFDTSQLNNLNNGKVEVIGHAGMGFVSWIPFNALPDNSMAALQKSIVEKQAAGIEVDLHMTKDEKFVLYHDEKLESKTQLQGCISEMNYKDLSTAEYKVGYPFDWFQEEKLLSFQELIQFLKSRKEFPLLQLDLRNKSACKSIEENSVWEKKMAMALHKTLLVAEIPEEKLTLITLSRELIQHFIDLETPYELSFEIVGDFDKGLAFAEEKSLKSVTVKPKLLSKAQSKLIHSKGIKIITFGAKSKSGNKKLLELNPDVIQTNNISALRELLEM